jgi:hypothetical protein
MAVEMPRDSETARAVRFSEKRRAPENKELAQALRKLA